MTMGTNDLSLIVTRESLPGMRDDLRSWLTDVGASNGEKEDIVLACWEAAANAIEHPLHADGHVHVGIERREGQIFVCVADDGEWRERREDRHERGFGLKLIVALMDHVEVVRTAHGTRILMSRCLSLSEPLSFASL